MIYRLVALSLVVLLAACSPENSGTGSIAPEITFVSKGAAAAIASQNSPSNLKAKTVNFGGSTLPSDLNTVRVTVTSGATVLATQDFPAAARTGTLTGVTVGSNRTLTVLGLDVGGVTRYQSIQQNLTVSTGVNPVAVVAVGTSPIVSGFARYIDVNGSTTVDSGDKIIVTFDQDVTLSSASINDFTLPVSGDSFGSGAVVSTGVANNEVVIELGSSPSLTIDTVYSGDTSSNSPSGIDVSSAVTGISAAAINNTLASESVPVDIVGSFTASYSNSAQSLGSDSSQDVSLGDFNNDGLLDMAVANLGQGLRVYLADSNGNYTGTGQVISNSTELNTTALALGDINGDSYLDIVLANTNSEYNAIKTNDGSGTFTDIGGYDGGVGGSDSYDVALGDIDGDGDLDMVFANNGANTIYQNDGSGSFSFLTSHDSNNSRGIALGDIDGDGNLDMIVANANGQNSFSYINNGSGVFGTDQSLGSSDSTAVALGDLDADGDLDVIISNTNFQANQVFINSGGSGGTLALTSSLGGESSEGVVLSDVDGDGDLDAIFANSGTAADQVYLNDGFGGFILGPVLGASDSQAIALGDIEGDGDIDIVVVNGSNQGNTVFLNNQPNFAPIANAGADQIVASTSSVQLNDAGSTDSDGSVVSYSWSQVSNGAPSVGTITNSTSPNATFTAPGVSSDTVFTFQLTVTDDSSNIDTDTVDVLVQPEFPAGGVIPAGWVQSTTTPTQTVSATTTTNRVVVAGWSVDTATTFDGSFSLKSDPISSPVAPSEVEESAAIEITDNFNAGNITFNYLVDSEIDWDYFRFYIDDVEQTSVTSSGQGAGWQSASFSISAGVHKLMWEYSKDGSQDTGLDAAWIDTVILPSTAATNVAPTANAGANQTVLSGAAVTLDGSASSDSDGSIASYSWVQSTGGTTVTLNNSGTVSPTFSAPTVSSTEVLSFELLVTDNDGSTSLDTVSVTVTPIVNNPPTANAGFDTTVGSNVAVVLTGSGSDTDGNIASYGWSQIGGPVVSPVTGALTESISFTSPTVGSNTALTFELTVTDNDGATATDTAVVTVTPSSNTAPTAYAGVDQIVTSNTLITLTGSGQDSDGNISVYSWSQISGPTNALPGATTSDTLNFIAPTVSTDTTYIFRLTVIDDLQSIATDDVIVTVSPISNNLPNANAGTDQTVTVGNNVILSGVGSTDDVSISGYDWVQTDGPIVSLTGAATSSASFTAPSVTSGTLLTFRLSVTDNQGGVDTDDIVITVNEPDVFPVSGVIPTGWIQSTSTPTTGRTISAGWVVASDQSFEGSQSLKSGAITANQSANIEYTANFEAGTVSFQHRVDSEASVDLFRFYIDNVLQGFDSGTGAGWQSFSTTITAGTHTLMWEYSKNGGTDVGADAAWIDDVVLPNIVTTTASVSGKARFYDTNTNGIVDSGDQLVVPFDVDVATSGATASDFTLPVSGDTLGTGATVADGPGTNEVTITLGTSPNLKAREEYSGNTSTNAASGIDISGSGSGVSGAVPTAPIDITPGFVDSGQALGSSNSFEVVLGDMDGDGDLDKVVANDESPNRIYFNDGLGNFTDSGLGYGDGAGRSQGVALGDLDADGDLDIVWVDHFGGTNRVYFNNGDGTITIAQSFTGDNSDGVSLGDIDGDGDLDMVVANTLSQGNRVYTNNGSGTFTDSGQSLGANNSSDIELGDIDGDGDLDMVVANASSEANRIYTNNGAGVFADSGQALGANSSVSASIGDVDGDGDFDIVFANTSGENTVYINDGAGVYADSGQSLGTFDSRAIALADMDADGDLDMVVTNNGASNHVYHNNGAGIYTNSMQPIGDAANASYALALGDVDADGDVDMVVGNITSSGSAANKVFLNSLSGAWGAASYSNGGQQIGNSSSSAVALGDLDGDGDLDQVVVNTGLDASKVYFNDSLGNYVDSGQVFAAAGSQDVVLGDIDGDGDLDFAVANANGVIDDKIWLNDGSGTFTDSSLLPGTAATTHGVAIGDLDGDGDLDLVFATGAGARINRNDAGTFTNTGTLSSSSVYFDVAIGDVDNDGDLDIVAAAGSSGPNEDRVWLNDGTGAFTDSGQLLGVNETWAIALGDMNGNGFLDIVTSSNAANDNRVYINNGFGTFTDSGQLHNGTRGVELADADGDGDLDVLFVGGSNTNLLINDGSGTLAASGQSITFISTVGTAIGDVDADGDVDIVVTSGGYNEIIYNSLSFGPSVNASDDQTVVSGSAVTLSGSATDPNGSISTYSWTQLSGTAVSLTGAASATASFNAPTVSTTEILTFSLSATDNDGITTTNFVTVTVNVSAAPKVSGKARFYDVNSNSTIDAGDQLIVPFDSNVSVSSATASDFSLPVTGDSLGSSPTIIAGPSSKEVTITLGTSPSLKARQDYAGVSTSNSPSGIDISGTNSGITGAVSSTAIDIIPGFVSAQSLGSSVSTSVQLGDIDQDGDLDMVVGNAGGQSNQIYLNSAGNFTDSGLVIGSSDTYFILLGDLDLDGDLDIVSANRNNQSNVLYRNPGTGGSFTLLQTLGNNDSYGADIGDVDSDGDLDLIFANYTSGQDNLLYLNDGTGLFSVAAQSLGTGSSLSVKLGDLDGDGDLDLVVGKWNSEANEIYFNNAGTFTNSGQTLGSSSTYGVALGDVDLDGDLDIATSNSFGQANRIYLNNGSGSFTDSGQALGSGEGRDVAFVDIDEDGDLDVIASNVGEGNRVYINDGLGTYTDSGQSIDTDASMRMAVGDVDGDGDKDLLVANESSQANKIYFNSLSGVWGGVTMTDTAQSLGAGTSNDVKLVDVDKDGDLDKVVANYNSEGNAVWTNDGLGNFTLSQLLGASSSWIVETGDVDSDGDIDLVFGNILEGNTVWLNNGSGIFSDSGQSLGSSDSNYGLALGDIDGDGDLDIFVTNYNSHANTVWVNNGSGTYSLSATLSINSALSVALGDVDGDGDLDAVLGGYANTPNRVMMNNGFGTFTDSGQTLGISSTWSLELGDMDGDGDLDIVAANAGNTNNVYLNGGTGIYSTTSNPLPFANDNSTKLSLGDVDGDGDLDIAVPNDNQTSFIWLNDGSATFSNSGYSFTTAASESMALGDVDNDGDLDVVVGNYSQTNSVYLNE